MNSADLRLIGGDRDVYGGSMDVESLRKQHGVALIESTVVLPVFMFSVFGAIVILLGYLKFTRVETVVFEAERETQVVFSSYSLSLSPQEILAKTVYEALYAEGYRLAPTDIVVCSDNLVTETCGCSYQDLQDLRVARAAGLNPADPFNCLQDWSNQLVLLEVSNNVAYFPITHIVHLSN